MRVAIKIGYEGDKFYGFAEQPAMRTIEGEIIKRLKKTGIIKNKQNSRFQFASRTDRGVSAFGNVIAFNSVGNSAKALEHLRDIWVLGYAVVEENFNPRFCEKKIYRYYLYNDGFDIQKIIQASKLFIGKHDFSYFARIENQNPIRKIDNITVLQYNNTIKIDFEGKSFLWNQLRRITAAIIQMGKEKIDQQHIVNVLKKKKRINFGLAPAENLVLFNITYPIEFFKTDIKNIIIKKEFFTDIFNLHRNK